MRIAFYLTTMDPTHCYVRSLPTRCCVWRVINFTSTAYKLPLLCVCFVIINGIRTHGLSRKTLVLNAFRINTIFYLICCLVNYYYYCCRQKIMSVCKESKASNWCYLFSLPFRFKETVGFIFNLRRRKWENLRIGNYESNLKWVFI